MMFWRKAFWRSYWIAVLRSGQDSRARAFAIKVTFAIAYVIAYIGYVFVLPFRLQEGGWLLAFYGFIFGTGVIAFLALRRSHEREQQLLTYSLTGRPVPKPSAHRQASSAVQLYLGQRAAPDGTVTGLDYFNARYYSPAQGRFVSVDPGNAGADPANPQTWNGYGYAGNNPLSVTDPSGEGWLTTLLGIGLDIAGFFTGGTSTILGTILTTGGSLLTGGTIGGAVFGAGAPGVSPASVGGIAGCGGPLGNCGGVGGGWTEQSPIGPAVQDPGRFIFNAEQRTGDVDLGAGWSASIDQFKSGEGFEIHVFKGSKEMGILSGRLGWIAKHQKLAVRPAGMPENVVREVNGLNVEWLRRVGNLPPAWRGFTYLNPGRLLGAVNILTLLLDEAAASSDIKGACIHARRIGRPGWIDTTMGYAYLPQVCATAEGGIF